MLDLLFVYFVSVSVGGLLTYILPPWKNSAARIDNVGTCGGRRENCKDVAQAANAGLGRSQGRRCRRPRPRQVSGGWPKRRVECRENGHETVEGDVAWVQRIRWRWRARVTALTVEGGQQLHRQQSLVVVASIALRMGRRHPVGEGSASACGGFCRHTATERRHNGARRRPTTPHRTGARGQIGRVVRK